MQGARKIWPSLEGPPQEWLRCKLGLASAQVPVARKRRA